VADSERHHPQHPTATLGRKVRVGVDCRRLAAEGSCRTAGQAAARFSRSGRASGGGRLRDALRSAVDSGDALAPQGRGLHAHSAAAALSAVRGQHDGHRLRCVGAWLQSVRNQPEIRSVRSFADHPGYIEALAASVREHWASHGRPDRLVSSGDELSRLPRYTLDKGDPYHCECQKTGRLLAEALGLRRNAIRSAFSRVSAVPNGCSRIPRQPAGARQTGVQRVDVICPGFRQTVSRRSKKSPSKARAEFLQAAAGSTTTFPASTSVTTGFTPSPTLPPVTCRAGRRSSRPMPASLELSALRARALGASVLTRLGRSAGIAMGGVEQTDRRNAAQRIIRAIVWRRALASACRRQSAAAQSIASYSGRVRNSGYSGVRDILSKMTAA
jgi:hypothetical protein